MDDSGDEFAWEETLDIQDKDTTDSSSMEDSEAEKEYKKKLHKELFKTPNEENCVDKHEIKSKKKKKSKHRDSFNSSNESDSYHLKTVKAEPESDIDTAKRKKTKKVENTHEESMDIDNSSYLDLLVKEEGSEHKKHKKKKRKECESTTQEDTLNTSVMYGNYSTVNENEYMDTSESVPNIKSELDTSRKKKKKHKKERDSLSETKESIVKELFSEGETTIGPPVAEQESRKKSKKSKKSISLQQPEHSNLTDENEAKQSLAQNGFSSEHSEKSTDKEHKKHDSPVLIREERNARISDRIIFEEEDSQLEVSHTDLPKHKLNKLQLYLKNHDNLKKITTNPSSDCTITSEDEVWILKCPSDFRVSSLESISFPLNSNKFKIKIDAQSYEGHVNVDESKHPILSYNQGKCIVQNVLLQGVITLRKRIPKGYSIEDKSLNTPQGENFIPLPEIKCRHPLFGPNYKKAIKLDTPVVERLRLDSREVTPPPSVKKKKHKSKVKCKEEETNNISEKNNETKEERKARKRAREESEENPVVKRARHAPAWDCEEDIQDHLFNY